MEFNKASGSNGSALHWQRLIFWAIFLFAALVRMKSLSTGLPLHTLYGESDTVETLRHMLQTGDLNPHQFDLPGLAYYIYFPFLILFYLIGHYAGYFPNIASVSDASFIFVGRLACSIFGTLTVPLIYRVGKYFSTNTALIAMAIFAAVPQHIEYCHTLRPEIPAILFVTIAISSALEILHTPNRIAYWVFGLAAGHSFSLKYMIGLPLLPVLAIAHLAQRSKASRSWLAEALFIFGFIFVVTNPFQVFHLDSIAGFWANRTKSLYVTGEDYYGKSMFLYYLEFLTRYNYNFPLIGLAIVGFIQSLWRNRTRGPLLATYPLIVFLWLCSFESRRVHGLLPLHVFISLWAAMPLSELWRFTWRFSRAPFFRIAYALFVCLVLVWPYYRSGVQSYLFSQMDNRSKAELWMTNRLAKGSKIALLQYNQVELNSSYFQIENLSPRDYVLNEKDFEWFRRNDFDYFVVSSGQYMRYFTEGESAQKYKDYFLKLFRDGEEKGTLILDLVTHPLLIPDYRIKVFSTRSEEAAPAFLPSIAGEDTPAAFPLNHSEITLTLEPGHYSTTVPKQEELPSLLLVKNLKLNETIRRKREQEGAVAGPDHQIPFSIFPVHQSSRFSVFAPSQEDITPNQPIYFSRRNGSANMALKRIAPDIKVIRVEFFPLPRTGLDRPYLRFEQHQPFGIRCHLRNNGNQKIAGYVEGFLSNVGEAQPWKTYELASDPQEFFLDPGQKIAIDIPLNTKNLTGDHQLSYWVFTEQEVPFSPQNGGWFNKQIRVNAPQLGIHPFYGIEIP